MQDNTEQETQPEAEEKVTYDPRNHPLFKYYDLRRYDSFGSLDEDATIEAIEATMQRRFRKILAKQASPPSAEVSSNARAKRRQEVLGFRRNFKRLIATFPGTMNE